jgi:hypothetical protein
MRTRTRGGAACIVSDGIRTLGGERGRPLGRAARRTGTPGGRAVRGRTRPPRPQAFFALPDSAGFAVAGGAALIARDLVDRQTKERRPGIRRDARSGRRSRRLPRARLWSRPRGLAAGIARPASGRGHTGIAVAAATKVRFRGRVRVRGSTLGRILVVRASESARTAWVR